MKLHQYLEQNFSGYRLSIPAFYQWHFALRFELGPPEIGQFSDSESSTYNETYFHIVEDKASKLYNAIMDENDELFVVYQRGAWERQRIRKHNFLFKQISQLDYSHIEYKTVRNLYDAQWSPSTFKRSIVNTRVNFINAKSIFQAISNQDFPPRKPTIQGEVFFINITKNVIFNMYDDRGLDIIAKNKEMLDPLYRNYNQWILDYDREKIDAVFK